MSEKRTIVRLGKMEYDKIVSRFQQ